MKKIFLFAVATFATVVSFAQTEKSKKYDLSGRPGDHFVVQLSSDNWMQAPDSISSHLKNTSRGANVYLMLDRPFKSNPQFSVAFGVGIGTSHIFFDKMNVDITGSSSTLKFNSLDTLNHYKKYKIATAFAEAPVELRYTSNPEKPNKSFKAAIGVKVGTLLSAHSKGKNLLNSSDQTIGSYTMKLSSKSYFNTTRIMATGRVGYGNFSLFAAYNLTSVFKDNVAPDMKLFQIGLCLSGL